MAATITPASWPLRRLASTHLRQHICVPVNAIAAGLQRSLWCALEALSNDQACELVRHMLDQRTAIAMDGPVSHAIQIA